MYCPSCGAAVAQALSYCNQCGARLEGEKRDSLVKTTELRAESLIVSAMVGLFVLGILAISVLMGVMKAVLGLDAGQVLGFAVLSFLVMIGIEGVLIWRLVRRRPSDGQAGQSATSSEHTTNELDAAQPRVLLGSMPSVTEHTTRAFDPIYTEKDSK